MLIQINLSKNNAPWLLKNRNLLLKNCENLLFSVKNYYSFKESNEEYINLRGFFQKLAINRIKLLNIPKCFYPEAEIITEDTFSGLMENETSIDVFVKKFFLECYYEKSLRCKKCIYDSKCKGMHINYLRVYGFKEFEPIIDL